MRKILSILLSFIILLGHVVYDYEEVFAFDASNISITRGGTVTHPTVDVTIDSGGLGIAGVTYERGYNNTATKDSTRIYGIEDGVKFSLEDVYRYVSVYVQLEDGSSATKNFELTGTRVYNTGGGTFSSYPQRPLTNNSSTKLVADGVGYTRGADNGVMIVTEEEFIDISAGGNASVYTKKEVDDNFLKPTFLDSGLVFSTDMINEYAASAVYDGRYIFVDTNASRLNIVDTAGGSKTKVSDVSTVVTNYGNEVKDGNVGAIAYDHENLYFLTVSGLNYDKPILYKAPRNTDGTYTINTTPLYTMDASAVSIYYNGRLEHINMIFDGTNIWIPGQKVKKITKVNVNTGAATIIDTNMIADKVVFDGKSNVYVTNYREIINDSAGLDKIDINTNSVTAVFSDIDEGYAKEDITFDGRNIWVNMYGGYSDQYYDTVENIQVDFPNNTTNWQSGANMYSNVQGVYDGKYLYLRNVGNSLTIVGRTAEEFYLQYGSNTGTHNTNLKKTFSENPLLDSTTPVYVDTLETTTPNYVDVATIDAKSASDIVFVAWSFSPDTARDAVFFENMDNYGNDTAIRGNEHLISEYQSKLDKYFEIPRNEYPTVPEGGGSFTYSLTTYPKLNGVYTLYMKNADGDVILESIDVNNYKQMGKINIFVQEVDSMGNPVEPTNYIFKDIDMSHPVGSEATISISEHLDNFESQGYLPFGATEKTITVPESGILTFYVEKDMTKWSKLELKPFYYVGTEKTYIPYTTPFKLYLVGDKDIINAPHIEGFEIKNSTTASKEVEFLNGGASKDTYGVTNVEFEYIPVGEIIINKGIVLDDTGKPTDEIVYSTTVSGGRGTTAVVNADKTNTKFNFVGLVNYNTDGSFKDVSTSVDNKTVKFGTDEKVVFAFTPKMINVKVEYVRKDNSSILGTDTFSVRLGGKLTLLAKEISGYKIAVGETEKYELTEVKDSDATTTYTFKYAPIGKTISVKGIEVDINNKPTGNVVYVDQAFGEDNEVREFTGRQSLDNWTLVGLVNYNTDGSFKDVSVDTIKKSATFGNDTEVVFALKRKMTNIDVKYIDENGNTIATSDSFATPLNDTFTGTAKAIEGYKLVNPASYQKTITADGSTTSISFVYKKLIENVTIEARLNTVDGTLIAIDSKDFEIGTKNVSISADTLISMLSPRYKLDTVTTPNPATLAEVTENSVVKFVFKEQLTTVTVNYKDEGNNSIYTSKTYKVPYGTTIRENAISIKDYYVDTASGKVVSVEKVASTPTETINFTYKKATGNITVITKDSVTGEILYYKTHSGTQGSTLSVDSTTAFTGQSFLNYYKLSSSETNTTKSLNYTDSHQEIIFLYDKITYTVTIKGVDANNNPISFFDGTTSKTYTYNKGSNYSIYAPPVKGYTVKDGTPSSTSGSNITANKTFTFTYELIDTNVNLTVKAVSEDGSIVIGAETITGTRNEVKSIAIADFSNIYNSNEWELADVSAKNATFGTDREILFKFKRKVINIKINFVEQATGDVLGTKTMQVPTNTTQRVFADYFDNYQLVEGEQSIKIINALTTNVEVTFNYRHAMGNIAVLAVDAETNEILERRVYNGATGSTFTADATIRNEFSINSNSSYIYDTSSTNSITVTEGGANEVFLKYKKVEATIVVKYVDDSGTEIALSKTYDSMLGSTIDEYAINIDYYNISSSSTSVTARSEVIYDNTSSSSAIGFDLYGTTSSSTISFEPYNTNTKSSAKVTVTEQKTYTITFVYKKVDYSIVTQGVINVIAKDDSGNTLEVKSFNGTIGASQTFEAKTIFGDMVGYELTGDATQTAEYIDGFTNVVFVYKTVDIAVNIKAIDSTSNAELSFTAQSQYFVQAGEDITLFAPHIPGYVVDGANSITFTNVTTIKTATFKYKSVENFVTIKGIEVDVNGKDLGNVVYSVIETGENLSTKTINAKENLTDWTLVGLVNYGTDGNISSISEGVKSKDVVMGSSQEVVFAYTRNSIDITANYVEAGTGTLLGSDKYTVPLNSNLTVMAKAIDGYKLLDSTQYIKNITAETANATQTFTYVKLEYPIIIEARLDSVDGTLLAQSDIDQKIGTTNVKVTADDLTNMLHPRYILDSTKDSNADSDNDPNTQVVSKVVVGSTVTYIFKEQVSTVTIKYLDEQGNKLVDDRVYTVPYGTPLYESALSIKDYYVDVNNSQLNYSVASAKLPSYSATFRYKKSEGSVSVIAKDSKTGIILYYKVFNDVQGNTLSINSSEYFKNEKFYEYYTLNTEISTGTQSKTYTNTHQEMIFLYDKVTYTINLKAVDYDTNQELLFFDNTATKAFVYNKGDDYIIYAPPVTGYRVHPDVEPFIKGSSISKNVEHTFKYEKVELQTNVTIKTVSEDGELIGSKTIFGDRKDTTTIDISSYDGTLFNSNEWELVGEKTKDVVFGTDYEAVFTFKRVNVNITINYLDNTGETILPSETISFPTNSTYTALAKFIPNYELNDGQAQFVDVNTETSDVTVNILYKPAEGNVLVRAIDLEDESILTWKYVEASVGSSYTVTNDIKSSFDTTLVGYTFDSTNSTDTISNVNADASKNIVTLVYTKKLSDVLVRYVDQEGNDLASAKSYKVQYFKNFEERALNIDFYNIVEGTDMYVKVENVDQSSYTIIFKYYLVDYTIVTDGVVNVIAKTQVGDDWKILDVKSFNGTIGDEQIFDAKTIFGEILGYTLSGTEQQSATFVSGFTNVEFIYNVAGIQIKIEAVDKATGNTLAFTEPNILSVKEGDSVTAYAPHISEYSVVGVNVDGVLTENVSYIDIENISKDTTVVFQYSKIKVPSTIIEKHISIVNGYEVLIESIRHQGNVGEALTARPKDFDGFVIDDNYNIEQTLYFGKNKEVIFLYDRTMFTLNINNIVEIYNNMNDVQNQTPKSTLTEADKRVEAPQLLNRQFKYESGSTQTIMAPFENEYVINTSKNTEALRQNVTMNFPIVNKDYYYRNIVGNVLVRAVVEDENGSLNINGKNYTILVQLDDEATAGQVYNNAINKRQELESLLSPSYHFDSNSGLITGTEIFTPSTDSTYLDNTLTYVFTADYKEVLVYYYDIYGELLPVSALGFPSNARSAVLPFNTATEFTNPQLIKVINGDPITQYALNAQSYSFVSSSITDSLGESTSNSVFYNTIITEDTEIKFIFEPDDEFETTEIILKDANGEVIGTENIKVIANQVLYAPYVDGYAPNTVFSVVDAVVQPSYTFTYSKVKADVKYVTNYVTKYEERDDAYYVDDREEFYHKPIIQGYPDGTIKPNNTITRAEIVTILYNYITDGQETEYFENNLYSDVSSDDWFAKQVSYMSRHNYINGYEDGTFKPNKVITREELATIITRIFADDNKADYANLPVDKNHWSTTYILTAYANGYYKDINISNVDWSEEVTRAESIVMVNNATNRIPNINYLKTLEAPSDITQSHWAYYHILEALNEHSGYYTNNFGEEEEEVYNGVR